MNWDSVKNAIKFFGPGFMVGLGYLDPGNWATDLSGEVILYSSPSLDFDRTVLWLDINITQFLFLLAGSTFGFDLLYVILCANFMSIILQYLCIKLGVVTGKDLAMSTRAYFSPKTNIAFFILCELAIIATDMAEVIGTAIALNLLFHIPIHWGVLLTCLDVIFILAFYESKSLRIFELGVIMLMIAVACCFFYLIFLCSPDWFLVGSGLIPSVDIFWNSNKLYLAMGVIGATVGEFIL